jgi:dipeptidyl aminopeptidase/acylaminoacyl peptidase
MSLPGGKLALNAAVALLALAGAALAGAPGAGAETAPVTPHLGRIAYVTSSEAKPESEVWTASGNGVGPRQLGPGNDPLLSPDGATVAASLLGTGSGKGPALALYPTSAARSSTLGEVASQVAIPLAWSPDSRYLAVALGSTALKGFVKKSGLAILDTTTGSLKTIATGIVNGASFAPDGTDRVVFGRASGENLSAAVNLYVAEASGAGLKRITSDGRSLNPVWGPRFIAYDRERLRRNDAPVYQIWLRGSSVGAARQLTSIHVRSLVSGLMPLGFSSDGTRLLAEFVGQDTTEAWTVQIASKRARRVRLKGQGVVGAAISRDGSRLLVTEGGLDGPADTGNVLTVPFAGGAPTQLVAHAAQPSWNE